MQKIILMLSLLIGSVGLKAQEYSIGFEEVDGLMQAEARPLLVFLHTDWCRYCQAMKKTTFQNAEVRSLLQERYYFVSFNAEHKEDVRFWGRTFCYEPTGEETGEHQLARTLIGKDGGYPTVVIMNPKGEVLGMHHGFLSKTTFKAVLESLANFEE